MKQIKNIHQTICDFQPNKGKKVIILDLNHLQTGSKEGNVYLIMHSAHFIYNYLDLVIW